MSTSVISEFYSDLNERVGVGVSVFLDSHAGRIPGVFCRDQPLLRIASATIRESWRFFVMTVSR